MRSPAWHRSEALSSLYLLPLGCARAGPPTDGLAAEWVFIVGGAFHPLRFFMALAVRGVRELD